MRRDRYVGIEMRAHLMVPRDVESCGGGRPWRGGAPYVCVAKGVFLSRRRDRLEIFIEGGDEEQKLTKPFHNNLDRRSRFKFP